MRGSYDVSEKIKLSLAILSTGDTVLSLRHNLLARESELDRLFDENNQ